MWQNFPGCRRQASISWQIVMTENPRLKGPLFLYALAFNKVELLLRYTANSTIAAEYEQLSNRYSLAQMLLLLGKTVT